MTTIALAGNPNTGKSTLFNALTGSRQHVGNWPGKTVEKRAGLWRHDGKVFSVVDLPGTYSLSAYSLEETITRDYIANEQPDVVLVVLDAANLERNLYLAVQVLESGANVVLALNHCDRAAARGIDVDIVALSRGLGAPVVATVGCTGQGVDALRSVVARAARSRVIAAQKGGAQPTDCVGTATRPRPLVDYGVEIEREIRQLEARIVELPEARSFDPRSLAIELLEQNPVAMAHVGRLPGTGDILVTAAEAGERLTARFGEDPDTLIVERRYDWINRLVRTAVRRPVPQAQTRSDRIDAIVTHRILGIPIFLTLMWITFKLTTSVSAPYLEWVQRVVDGPITNWARLLLRQIGLAGSWIDSLLIDGVVAGVGGVLAFVPVLMALYVALAVLEDSGYMARAPFIMDRLMRLVGLHSKSFLPMIVGFGCTVPAMYATRTLEDNRERILTGLLVPFMSCGARLPVYILFATIFYPRHSSLVVFGMYVIGIGVAVLLGMLLRRTLFRTAEDLALVLELPPYRLPTVRGIWQQTWTRTYAFLRTASTVILAASIVIWALMAIPVGGGHSPDAAPRPAVAQSAFRTVSSGLAPIIHPLGFGSWETAGALMSGVVAKEVVVSTLIQVYAVGDDEPTAPPSSIQDDIDTIFGGFVDASADTLKTLPQVVGIYLDPQADDDAPLALRLAIRSAFESMSGGRGALAGLAFMVFVLLYTPCMVTVAVERRELGARWMWLSISGQFAVAWLAALVVFQGGRILGFG